MAPACSPTPAQAPAPLLAAPILTEGLHEWLLCAGPWGHSNKDGPCWAEPLASPGLQPPHSNPTKETVPDMNVPAFHTRKQVQRDQEPQPHWLRIQVSGSSSMSSAAWTPHRSLGQTALPLALGMGPRRGCWPVPGPGPEPHSSCHPLSPTTAHPTNQLSSLLTFRPVVKLSASSAKGPLGV